MNALKVPVWCVVPAAGVGRRFGGETPKQYLPLAGRRLIDHTLERLLQVPAVHGVVVSISAEDEWFETTVAATAPRIHTCAGGAERCHSVLNALTWLQNHAGAADPWVLVHDAARPCVRVADINLLLDVVMSHHPQGGLLATPVRDTLKRAGGAAGSSIQEVPQAVTTVDRTGLWQALTPQLFRLQQLQTALTGALAQGQLVTDEASAIELAGEQPALVGAHSDNIKVTHPEDLWLAEVFLQAQEAAT